jgi:hypothetical protein
LVIAGQIAVGGYAIAKKEGFGQLGADLVNSGFDDPASRPLFDLICRRRVSTATARFHLIAFVFAVFV